jgi:hypothetical protein
MTIAKKSETDREIRTVQMDVSIEAREDGKGKRICGYAAVFNEVTDIGWFKERIAKGAFLESLEKDDVRSLFNHNPDYVLGRSKNGTCKMKEDERGLFMEVDPPDTQQARDIMALIERGDVTGQSFSFRVEGDEWEYGEGNDQDLRTLTKVRLYDVGPVTFPAYEGTSVNMRSYEAMKEKRSQEQKSPEKRYGNTNVKRKRLSMKTQEVTTL